MKLYVDLCRYNFPHPVFLQFGSFFLGSQRQRDYRQRLASLSRTSLTVPNEWIQEVVDAGGVPRIVALLGKTEILVITPYFANHWKIVSSSDVQSDSVLAAGSVPCWPKLLQHSKMNIQSSPVSNITSAIVQVNIFWSSLGISQLIMTLSLNYEMYDNNFVLTNVNRVDSTLSI